LGARPLILKRYCDYLSTEASFEIERDPNDYEEYYTLFDNTMFGRLDGGAPASNDEVDLYDECRKGLITREYIRYAFRSYLRYMETTFYIWHKNCYDIGNIY
jgi:hypothetical protein